MRWIVFIKPNHDKYKIYVSKKIKKFKNKP